jgi:hypothetical protein
MPKALADRNVLATPATPEPIQSRAPVAEIWRLNADPRTPFEFLQPTGAAVGDGGVPHGRLLVRFAERRKPGSVPGSSARAFHEFASSRLFGRLPPCILPRLRLAGVREPLTNPAETVAMRLNLRVAFLAAIAWLNARPNKMQDHRHDRQEANAISKHNQQPENEKLRGEGAGFQAVIGEILSEEDHQAAQRKGTSAKASCNDRGIIIGGVDWCAWVGG